MFRHSLLQPPLNESCQISKRDLEVNSELQQADGRSVEAEDRLNSVTGTLFAAQLAETSAACTAHLSCLQLQRQARQAYCKMGGTERNGQGVLQVTSVEWSGRTSGNISGMSTRGIDNIHRCPFGSPTEVDKFQNLRVDSSVI